MVSMPIIGLEGKDEVVEMFPASHPDPCLVCQSVCQRGRGRMKECKICHAGFWTRAALLIHDLEVMMHETHKERKDER